MSRQSKKRAPRVPLGIAGGIRAQAGRGRQAHHWWGQRWLALLESFMLGPRLGRGRSYAASGQVADLRLEPGLVTAVVQGASPEPYRVQIRFRALNAGGRGQVLAALHAQPLLAARLLVRELPLETEALFRDAGCALFPTARAELDCDCTCPDWANPCKHVAAVCFLLGEAIDRDPLLLLALRGVTHADLVGTTSSADADLPLPSAVPLAAAPTAFWGAAAQPGLMPQAAPDFGPVPDIEEAAPLIRRLGPLRFWRGEERFLDAMHAVYARAASRGWAVWSGERLDLPRAAVSETPRREGVFHLRRRRLNMDLTMR